MHIFKDGRAIYLEFLRNLTPQAVVLSLALVAGRNLQASCCHLENTKETIIFLCFLSIWALAAWANSSLFVEKYLVSSKRIHRASRLLNFTGTKSWRTPYTLLKFAWRKERSIFFESILVLVVIEAGLVMVAMSAVGAATTFLRLMHS